MKAFRQRYAPSDFCSASGRSDFVVGIEARKTRQNGICTLCRLAAICGVKQPSTVFERINPGRSGQFVDERFEKEVIQAVSDRSPEADGNAQIDAENLDAAVLKSIKRKYSDVDR
jgi:hypothetical protein